MALMPHTGRFSFNGLPLAYACTQAGYNAAVACLAADGYYGKPFFCGMRTYNSFDLLARAR